MIQTHLIAALAAAVIAFGAGWQVRAWKAGAEEATRLQAEQSDAAKRALRTDQAAVKHEATKAAIRQQIQTITQEVERVIEKPVYRNVCLDDDGLRLITEALTDPGQPAPAMPAASASR